MPSDKERRAVAQKLRMLPTDMPEEIHQWERDGLFINTNDNDEADYSQLHNVIMGCFPAEHMHPGDYEELHRTLADLIDRPTCEDVSVPRRDRFTPYVEFKCSACGCSHFSLMYVYYCPWCGAEVVDDD